MCIRDSCSLWQRFLYLSYSRFVSCSCVSKEAILLYALDLSLRTVERPLALAELAGCTIGVGIICDKAEETDGSEIGAKVSPSADFCRCRLRERNRHCASLLIFLLRCFSRSDSSWMAFRCLFLFDVSIGLSPSRGILLSSLDLL